MSNIQKQHKISPAIAWLTIQKFIIFYCPLDGEHTKVRKACLLQRFRASLFFNPAFTRANASHAITFLSMQPHKTKQETRQGICIFPVQSLYDLSCFCISTFAQIFILLSALLQPSQQLLLYLLLLQSLLRSPPVHLKPCVPLRYLQLLRVPSD